MTLIATILLALTVQVADLTVAPALWNVARFDCYSREMIVDLLAFNHACRSRVAKLQELYHSVEYYSIFLREFDQIYAAWDALRDAKCDCYSVMVRRDALGKLLKIIGPEMFERGEMPPNVPTWRLTWVRR